MRRHWFAVVVGALTMLALSTPLWARLRHWLAVVVGALTGLSCVGTTGSDVIEFWVFGAGPADVPEGAGYYAFDTSAGYHIALSRAKLRIGGVYLNRSRPIQGAQDTPCILPGVYAAQMTEGVEIDVLSPVPQAFPSPAQGTADRALTGEVWLTGGRVDALDDHTTILDIAGEAYKDGVTYRFASVVTIGQNRFISSSDPGTPGANPLCKLRIITPINIDLTPSSTGKLLVRADPKVWLDRVDFSQLEGTGQEVRQIPDQSAGQPATNLFAGLRAVNAYSFEWRP